MPVDLSDLDAFAVVARARSFRGAAKLMGVSASSLSEALRRLEQRIGVRLLHRTTRSVTPTEAGLRLLERLSPALQEVKAALDDVAQQGDQPTGTLRLNVNTVAAYLILPPILPRFLAAHPGIVVDVVNDDSFIDVLAAGFDAGVRYDERLERDMIAIPIGPRQQHYVTCAAPAYWAAHGRPSHPQDLLEHRCIRHRFHHTPAPFAWEFERNGHILKIDVRGPLVATFPGLELDAARQGLGVVHTFDGFVADDIAAGRLQAVLEDWSEPFSGPFLYYAGRRHMPPPLRAFVDFLKHPNQRPA